MVAHTALVWGYTGTCWGDYGMWLHQVERVAQGDALYRDVYVSTPPLAFRMLGGAARSNLAVA